MRLCAMIFGFGLLNEMNICYALKLLVSIRTEEGHLKFSIILNVGCSLHRIEGNRFKL